MSSPDSNDHGDGSGGGEPLPRVESSTPALESRDGVLESRDGVAPAAGAEGAGDARPAGDRGPGRGPRGPRPEGGGGRGRGNRGGGSRGPRGPGGRGDGPRGDAGPRVSLAPLAKLVAHLAKALVDRPEEVEVREAHNAPRIELLVAPDDIGKVIGKDGRTAQCIRALLLAAASRTGARVQLEILD